ncbi:acyl-CoA dehydrogenase family protein [Tardiphaga sp. 813_E8_N1_3]|uniref:acyl-CoA dehydrogenase family protein n=1 Tax=Tardiphaga sp. 813_E8_N1_3 TaxID=3240760 RepID=UPI003F286E6E
MSIIPACLSHWLEEKAEDIDFSPHLASEILPRIGGAGVFRQGIPAEFGGDGGDIADAVVANAALSEHSLAAGFVAWGQRTFIEFVLRTPNAALRERLIGDLLTGRRAGASGLSNAMKFLSGIERLQIVAEADGELIKINGKLPWVTNLRPDGFDVAAAIQGSDGRPSFVASLASELPGLERSNDLDLMGMQASNTAAVDLVEVRIGPQDILFPDTQEWLPKVRPAFLALQCAMSVGLARRSLLEAMARAQMGRHILLGDIERLTSELRRLESAMLTDLRDGRFVTDPAALFLIRIRLAEVVAEAIQLELYASGGSAYIARSGKDFQRRAREAAFIPIITPSIVQLKTVLEEQRQRQLSVVSA